MIVVVVVVDSSGVKVMGSFGVFGTVGAGIVTIVVKIGVTVDDG